MYPLGQAKSSTFHLPAQVSYRATFAVWCG